MRTCINADGIDIDVEKILLCALRNKKRKKLTPRGFFAEFFGMGSTSSAALCRHLGVDPETGEVVQRYCNCGREADETGYCDECIGG